MRCAVGCGYLQRPSQVDSELVAITENPAHPATSGEACQRGMNETARPGGDRLTRPLIRRGNSLQPTDWDTALGVVTTRLIDAVRTDPDTVSIFGSGQQTNEAAYALGKMARGVIGTQHYDANHMGRKSGSRPSGLVPLDTVECSSGGKFTRRCGPR